MLLRLQRYHLHGTEIHIADALSRARLEGQPNVCAIKFQDVEATELSVSPERLQAIKAATASDTVFQSLSEVVKQGWLEERSKLKSELYHFFQIRQGRSQAFFGSTHKVRMILNCTDHSQKY